MDELVGVFHVVKHTDSGKHLGFANSKLDVVFLCPEIADNIFRMAPKVGSEISLWLTANRYRATFQITIFIFERSSRYAWASR